MKKKTIIFIALILSLLLLFWYFKYIYGRMEFRRNTDTPKEFLNNVMINKEKYSKDSIEILNQLRKLLLKHEDFFYSKAYFDSTQLIIDSIIYSKDFNKLAVFVIAKNPTYSQLMTDEKHDWYCDATCYLGG
jgi:hypothetical protein